MEWLFLFFWASPFGCDCPFITLVVTVPAFDLGVLNKDGDHETGAPERVKLSALCIALGLGCSVFVYLQMGEEPNAES